MQKFNQDAFEACDEPSIKIVLEFLKNSHNCIAIDNTRDKDGNLNENRYGVDITFEQGDREGFIDVEVRSNWDKEKFPYSTVHVPYRKKKFAILKNFRYFVLNYDMTKCLVCKGSDILKSVIKELKTTRTEKGEKEEFFDVPIKKFKLHKLK